MHLVSLIILATLPAVVFAATPQNLKELIALFTKIIGVLIPLIFALIFITISWGVVKAWIMGEGSSDEIDKGKKLVVVGVIVLAIMVSIWGIIRIITGTLFGT